MINWAGIPFRAHTIAAPLPYTGKKGEKQIIKVYLYHKHDRKSIPASVSFYLLSVCVRARTHLFHTEKKKMGKGQATRFVACHGRFIINVGI